MHQVHSTEHRIRARRGAAALLTTGLCLMLANTALAQPAHLGATTDPYRPPQQMAPVPAEFDSPDGRRLWDEGVRLEQANRFLDAALHYEQMAQRSPKSPQPYWKASRNYWRFAEAMPGEAKAERLPYFETANRWATQGLVADPECAECMLWKFGAMGRIGTTRGVLSSLRMAPEMAELLDKGIALKPTYADGVSNSTLGNLYYAGAVFYRIVPEWKWLDWLVGVKGDLDQALDYARKARGISEERVDYRVELGATLLCFGQRREETWAIREGMETLRKAPAMPSTLSTDHLDKEHARTLVGDPGKACGYSRDGWIDLEEESAQAH